MIRRLPLFGLFAIVLGALLVGPSITRAESYNEAIFGDLSSDPSDPDPIQLTHSLNIITGTVGGGDIDVLKMTIPAYHHLDSLILNSYSGASLSFMGIQNGTLWTAGTGGAINPAALLGWTHFGPGQSGTGVGADLLVPLGTPKNGSAGFTPPLNEGVYAFLLQDTGDPVNYSIKFNVSVNLLPAGDFNGDLLINHVDLEMWQGDFGVNAESNVDGDSDSDGFDFLTWQLNFGRNLAPASPTFGAVPEPSSLALAAIGILLAARRRRRQPS